MNNVSQADWIAGTLILAFVIWIAARKETAIYLGFFGIGGGQNPAQAAGETTQAPGANQPNSPVTGVVNPTNYGSQFGVGLPF